MVGHPTSCGHPFVGLGTWLTARSIPATVIPAWPQLRGRHVIGTYRGRSAVSLACRMLEIGHGHDILVPAYNCGTEIDALMNSGANLIAYPVSRRCEVDLADLVARRTRHTRAVYLIHYFGWEQPMHDLRDWCDKEGLLLIEDCALSLFSGGPSGAMGRTGDAAIFSLPKTLGLRHGGFLSLPRPSGLGNPALQPAGPATLLAELRYSGRTMIRHGLDCLGLHHAMFYLRRPSLRTRKPLGPDIEFPPMPGDYYFNPTTDENRCFHPRLAAVANALSCDEIIRRRRRNYQRLATALSNVRGAELLHAQLPEAVCPLSLPILHIHRNACVARLQLRGIDALPWWAGFHTSGIDWPRFPEATWLKHHLLTLPVHQGLQDHQIDYLADTASEIFSSHGTG